MKIIITLIIAATFITAHSFAQSETEKGIEFNHNSWSDIVAQAKKENKLIFLDAYASWCGPCKWMSKNVFTNDAVAAYYNQTFVCAKIDMEKGEGVALAKKFNVKNYPTLLYIDANETLVHRTCGVEYTPEFSATFIQNGKDALIPEKRIGGLHKAFENNYANSENAFAYINALDKACSSYSTELKQYFDTQKESDLASATNWMMVSNFVNDPNSREFNYLFTNRDAFAKQHTKDSVDEKIANVFENGLHTAIQNKNDQDYLFIKKKVQMSGIKNSEALMMKSDLDFYKSKKDWSNYSVTASKYIDKYEIKNPQMLNSVAWTFYENVTEKRMLELAESWIKRAVELQNNYAYNDTYSAVLYKLGKKSEAEAAAEKAIELAKQENSDYKETSELLVKIKAMK